jgi:hypothetical protein
MFKPALVQEYTGTVDFNRVSPILEQEDGRRWRLLNAHGLLIGDKVRVAAVEVDALTLDVKAILETADPFALA